MRPLHARLGALALAACALSSCSTVTTPKVGGFTNNPCQPAATVTLTATQSVRMDCSAGGTTVTLAGGGASYLIVPQFATDQEPNQFFNYSLASGTLAASPSASRRAAAAPAAALLMGGADGLHRPLPGAAQRSADRQLLARASRLAASGSFRRTASLRGAGPAAAPPPPGSIRSFHVLSSFTTSPTWATVGAQLAYVGGGILLYVDTLTPANGFTAADLQSFGQYFDQVMFPIDTTAFGAPTDVDGNGRVIVLMSPVVNADTPVATCTNQGYVAGFFDAEDFNAADPNANQGEIFYAIVPDPTGARGCVHSVAEVRATLPSVFLHELQHLINFSQHVIVSGGAQGSSWMDEGLSILAEELGSVYYEQQCPPPACRTSAAQLFPDSSQGFVQNMLVDSYLYALLPDTASITLGDDSQQGFSWRGGSWLLMRYLGDRFGSGFYRQLERGPANAIAGIELATGQTFPSLFADFGLALYTDSLPGLPRATATTANRFVSRNVSALWARLFTTSQSTSIPVARPIQLFPVSADTTAQIMVPGTMTFYRLDTPASSGTVAVRFAAPGGQAFPAALKAQLAIFRLPPGQ